MALMVGRAQAMNFEVLKIKDFAAVSAEAYQHFLEDMSISVDEANQWANAVWDSCEKG